MTTIGPNGYFLAKGDGERIWFLGTLMTVKAGNAQTHGGFTVLEQTTPPASQLRRTSTTRSKRPFTCWTGQLHVTCGEQTRTADRGSFVFLPRGIPHAFSVVGTHGAK